MVNIQKLNSISRMSKVYDCASIGIYLRTIYDYGKRY